VSDQADDSHGKISGAEFKLRVCANGADAVHNWNLPVFGGALNSSVSIPYIREEVHDKSGESAQSGIGNVGVGLVEVGYHRGDLHLSYGFNTYLPGPSCSQKDALHIGQHNYAFGSSAGFTYLPHRGSQEISSRLQYVVNFTDTATHYHGGNEFTEEYDVMQSLTKRIAIGVNGFFFLQTTDDGQNGALFGTGNRGRDSAVGPQVRIDLRNHVGITFKLQKDELGRVNTI
jgi:hypothetical protein